MTVSAQVKQTIASLQGAKATLETFRTHEADQPAKETLEKNVQVLGKVLYDLENRVKQLEFEEPQYKGF